MITIQIHWVVLIVPVITISEIELIQFYTDKLKLNIKMMY